MTTTKRISRRRGIGGRIGEEMDGRIGGETNMQMSHVDEMKHCLIL